MTQILERRHRVILSKVKSKKTLHRKTEQRILLLMLMIPLVSSTVFFVQQNLANAQYAPMKSGFVIQNLRGDITNTWLAWDLVEGRPLQIQIQNDVNISTEKIDAIKEAIISTKTVEINDLVMHKGTKESSSIYYIGWKGATEKASQAETKYYIPTEFQIVESKKGQADIVIELTSLSSGDGYTGYTKAIADENHILKSHITIYKADTLSAEQLETITRHEFGHALGLAHSTAPEDLMAPVIQTDYPYVSDCDIDTITTLYDGGKKSQVMCEK